MTLDQALPQLAPSWENLLWTPQCIPLGKTLLSLLLKIRMSLGWHEPSRQPRAQLYRVFGEAEVDAVPLLEQTPSVPWTPWHG